MSFIPLNRNNFIKNKIKGITKVYYNKKNRETFIYDDVINSKNLLFNKENYSEKLSNIDFNIDTSLNAQNQDAAIDVLKSACKILSANSLDLPYTQIDFLLSRMKNIISDNLNFQNSSEVNELLKNYNFRNEFHIEKFNSNFILGDNFFEKKNILKRELYYNFYNSEDDNFIRNKNFGFCNYNTLNFFSVNKDNTSHENCIIYPNNRIDSHSNEYDFINKDVFYFQTRLINRQTDYLETPKCVIHIPGIFNLYVVKSNSNQNYRIILVTEQLTKVSINKIFDSYLFNLNNEKPFYRENLYISDCFLEENKWYTLGFILNKNRNTSELYVDGILKENIKINVSNEQENINSYICVGNKPNYLNKTKNDYITSYNTNFDFYFNRTCFLEKDIRVNNSNFLDANTSNLEQIITQGEVAFFDNNLSEGFLGELSDIRFYAYSPSDKEILDFHENSVKSIINNDLLSFYLPVYYIPDMLSKKGLLTAEGIEDNIAFYTYYNPYFCSIGGGFELSLENYLIEFKKNTKPNVVLNGKIFESILYEKTGEGYSYVINSNISEVEERFGKGERINNIYYDLYNRKYIENFNILDDASLDVYASNLLIKNHMILPNDNGIPNVFFDVIKEFCETNNITLYNTFKSFGENIFYNLNCEDILKDSKLFTKESIDYQRLVNYKSKLNFSSYNIDGNISLKYDFTFDPYLDVSNITYHTSNVNNYKDLIADLVSKGKIFESDKLNGLRSQFIGSDCNPFCREIQNSAKKLISGSVISHKTGFNSTVEYFQYENMIGNFFKEYDNYFINIVDIPVVYFNSKIQKKSLVLKDNKVSNISQNQKITIKDDGYGLLYRGDCLTKHADWNYVGNIIYTKGLLVINNITLTNYLDNELDCTFNTNSILNVQEINIPLDYDEINYSQNNSYDSDLRKNEFAINSENPFVYITDVFLHDENFNIVSKSKIINPIKKSDDDRFLIRLRMDY